MKAYLVLWVAAATVLLGLVSGVGLAADPTTVSTFESIGVSWSPPEGAPGNVCEIRYRAKGTTTWRQGYPLWFDDRDGEYRGSIVHLKPGTTFDIELELVNTATLATLDAATWSEHFNVGVTEELPIHSTDKLMIDASQSGSANAYRLFTFGAAGEATIDCQDKEHCIEVDASYIIIRGLRLENATRHAIHLYGKAHDVIIEENEFTNWGRVDWDGWGFNYDSAVYANHPDVERIIVQRNRIYDPRSDSNSWNEPRPAYDDELHPRGPQAICLFDSEGNHVFRYNEVTTQGNYFNDIFGAGSNFLPRGFPNRDSDIYGNFLSGCWDDGIEAEGANRNVRIWGNYIEWTFVKIAAASTVTGPLYVWRNLSAEGRHNDQQHWNQVSRGGFFKTSDNAAGGRMHVFHNTLLQPEEPPGVDYPLGVSVGLGHGGPMINAVSRNNVLHVYKNWHDSIKDGCTAVCGDYDHDVFNGDIHIPNVPPEPNGIHAEPIYDPGNGPGEFALDPVSPGFDDGQIVPNFNDGYAGAAPDIGAFEAGSRPMEFGVDAHRLTLYEASDPQDLVDPANAAAILPAPPAPLFDHAPEAGSLLFYKVDDRRGYDYTIAVRRGDQGLLIQYD